MTAWLVGMTIAPKMRTYSIQKEATVTRLGIADNRKNADMETKRASLYPSMRWGDSYEASQSSLAIYSLSTRDNNVEYPSTLLPLRFRTIWGAEGGWAKGGWDRKQKARPHE